MIDRQCLAVLEAHVEALFSNAFKMLEEKLVGAAESKVLYEHFDAEEMRRTCEPYGKFQRLVGRYQAELEKQKVSKHRKRCQRSEQNISFLPD